MLKKALISCIFLAFTSLYAQTLSNGEVSSRDLLTKDIKEAEQFYTKLFNWKSRQNNKYIELYANNILMANLVQISADRQAQWMPQFAYEKLLIAKENVLKNGGTILKEVTTEQSGDKYLLIKDSQGAMSVLTDDIIKEKTSKFPAINEWLWDELWSHDVSKSQDFYAHLFSYKVEKLDTGYIIFKNNDKWTTGLLNNPFEKSQTQWVSTIRVSDPKATSDKAVALGGKVLVGVEENKGHRDAALIADPSGAVFIVEKYEEK